MKSLVIEKLMTKSKTSKNKDSTAHLQKSRIKVEIETLCDSKLVYTGDMIQFEIDEKNLDYVISIVETGMISKYDIVQLDRTVFGATLKEVDLL